MVSADSQHADDRGFHSITTTGTNIFQHLARRPEKICAEKFRKAERPPTIEMKSSDITALIDEIYPRYARPPRVHR